jgi:hypothetical protein
LCEPFRASALDCHRQAIVSGELGKLTSALVAISAAAVLISAAAVIAA